MADFAAVTFLERYLHKVLDHLAQVAWQDENLGLEVKEKVIALLKPAEWASIFLRKFDGRRNKHEKVKEVVNQIRDVVHEAEDVIDQFILDLLQHSKRNKLAWAVDRDHHGYVLQMHRKRNKLAGAVYRDHHRDVLQMVVMKMEAVVTEIDKIYSMEGAEATSANRLLFEESKRVEVLHRRARSRSSLSKFGRDNSYEVSYVGDSTTLVEQLIKGNPQLDFVSIVGTAGLGKTTLARKIYNDVDIKSHFDCRAWVCVSQTFRTRELLLEVLKCEMPKSDELTRKKQFKCLSESELKKKLYRYLQGRRYLIVMDDIWRTEHWNEVRSAFPDNEKGSRILITGHLETIATPMNRSSPYILPFLNEGESWELFCKRVFRGRPCPPKLEDLVRQVAKGCCGLPLSIVLLGGLLASQEETQEAWSSLIGKVNWSLTEASAICKDIAALSYDELPRLLKPCFLYLGAYPEGQEIPVRQLINLWMAEGFTKYFDFREPEDVAEDCLEELIARSLMEVASRRTDGGVKTCRIHDLLRGLCISESSEEKFLEVCKDISHLTENKSRRLSIQGSIDPYISSKPSYLSSPRSLLFLRQDTCDFDSSHWTWIHEDFKLVRVLNFGHTDLSFIPTSIGRLIHLRYLGIKPDALKAIPASICNLMNLETLDMRGTFLSRLPKGIGKLRRLRNLYMSGPVSLADDSEQDNIGTLFNLRVLSTVYHNTQTSCVIEKLRNLKKLGIWLPSDEGHEDGMGISPDLPFLQGIRTLKIINGSLSISLRDLGRIEKLTLRGVCLDSDALYALGNVRSLTVLKLQSCLLPRVARVNSASFLRLKVLKLDNLRIERWESQPGALGYLEHLVIRRCIGLTRLDFEPETLTRLRNVEILWSPSELGKALQEIRKKVGFNLLIYPPQDAEVTEKLSCN